MFSSVLADESVLLAVAAAIVASLAMSPLARAVARRLRVLDAPDGIRKRHDQPVPLWGGVAVYLALVTGLLVARYASHGSAAFDQLSTTIIFAAGLVCLVGCIDDSRDLNARFKLLLQVVSVIPVVLAGYYFDRVVAFGYPIDLGWLGIPLTVLWLVGCINALNLIDGLDGLASVVGISAALIMAIIATKTGHAHVGVVAIVLAGSLLGFLVYNLPPASIFLGDSGSMVIGLVVGMISIQGALKTSATLSIAVPAVVMSIPMLDTVFAIVRRKLSGRPFDVADRGHIHHRLMERGLTSWQALCIIGALCLTTGAAATAATLLRFESLGWITAIALVVLLVRTRAFGHHEVALAKEKFSAAIHHCSKVLGDRVAQITGKRRKSAWDNAWCELLRDVTAKQAAGLELLLASPAVQNRYSWRNPAALPADFLRQPLGFAYSRPDGTFWQLQLLGLPTSNDDAEILPALTTKLHQLARLWHSDSGSAPPAGLNIECHQTAVEFFRPAA